MQFMPYFSKERKTKLTEIYSCLLIQKKSGIFYKFILFNTNGSTYKKM